MLIRGSAAARQLLAGTVIWFASRAAMLNPLATVPRGIRIFRPRFLAEAKNLRNPRSRGMRFDDGDVLDVNDAEHCSTYSDAETARPNDY